MTGQRRPSRALARYMVPCPRCQTQVSKGEVRGVKSFWSDELFAIVEKEGLGAIFKCPRCLLSIRVVPSVNHPGRLALQKPERKRKTTTRSERIPVANDQDSGDETRKLQPGEVVPAHAEVEIANAPANGDDTQEVGADMIDLYKATAFFLDMEGRVKQLIEDAAILLGRYRLHGKIIGRGADAIVASATNLQNYKIVVLKFQVKTAGSGEESAVARARVKRTFALQLMVNSWNSVRAIELIEHPFGLIPVEDYIGGIALKAVLDAGETISEDWAKELAMQLAGVFRIAWARCQIVHRDVKPANIMIREVDEHLEAVLVDYGVARSNKKEKNDSAAVYHEDFDDFAVEEAIETITQSGLIIGTPFYLAPEQVNGRVDVRTDLYALGVTLYHAVSGVMPFKASNQAEILKNVVYKVPTPLHKLKIEGRPKVSRAFSDIVAKLMEKDPADRYQTPDELIEALNLSLTGDDPKARPQSGITDWFMGMLG